MQECRNPEGMRQARRHGGHYGAVPTPNENCDPPSDDCASKKVTGSGLLKCKSRPKLVFASCIFVILVDWLRISWYFGVEDLFFVLFLEITSFRPENPSEFQWRLVFFFGDHLFSAGKTIWISNFGRKIPQHFWSLPCSYDPDWDKFLVPRAPLELT